MFNWLKMHFIPHEGNGHRPHILHQKNIHRILGLVIFIEVFTFLIPTIAFVGKADNNAILPSVLSQLTNEARAAQNLPALTVSPLLNEAAQAKANDMAANGYFAHVSPDGKTPWYWLQQVGYNYSYAGENLAVNFTDAQDVSNAWMNSAEHRANILQANYTEVGTGVAEGMYEGNEAIFVAQDFGNPAAMAPVADAVVPPTVASTPSVATTPPVTNQKVLGAETAPSAKHITPIVPTKTVPVTTVVTTPTVVGVQLVVPTAPVIHPTLLQQLEASPRQTTNMLLFVIMAIVALAVFLNIGVRISHYHPDLALNGVMIVAVIGCVFVMNNYISKSNTTLIQSVNYTANNTIL